MRFDKEIVEKIWNFNFIDSNHFIVLIIVYSAMHLIPGAVFLFFLNLIAENIFNSDLFELSNYMNGTLVFLFTIYIGIVLRCIIQFLITKLK